MVRRVISPFFVFDFHASYPAVGSSTRGHSPQTINVTLKLYFADGHVA